MSRAGGCDRKQVYETFGEAEAAAERTPAKPTERRLCVLNAYWCAKHGGYHLGHSVLPKWVRRAASSPVANDVANGQYR